MRRNRRSSGTAAIEFALIALPFLMTLLLVFEQSYDLFTQSVLDAAMQTTARAVQTGNAQNKLTGAAFMDTIVCPALGGILSCANLHVSVRRLDFGPGQDVYDYTTGAVPVTNGQLDLSGFSSASFCNGGPAQMLLVSAVYVGPAFLGQLLPGAFAVSYQGQTVHATLSTVALVSESYPPAAAPPGSAASC